VVVVVRCGSLPWRLGAVGAAPLWLLCGTGAIIFVATVLVPPTAAARAPAAQLLLILLLLVLLPVVIVSIVVAIVVAVPARAPRAAVRHRELQRYDIGSFMCCCVQALGPRFAP
jgi:hypothetical protein